MKKIFVVALASFLFCATSRAQVYKTAVGLTIDVGDGATFVGPSIKYFLQTHHALVGEVLYADNSVLVQGFYEYHQSFPNLKSLQWYVGGGAALGIYNRNDGSRFYLRPIGGLDYKIPNVPLAASFDWRPLLYVGNRDVNDRPFGYRGQDNVARFGLGIKYILN